MAAIFGRDSGNAPRREREKWKLTDTDFDDETMCADSRHVGVPHLREGDWDRCLLHHPQREKWRNRNDTARSRARKAGREHTGEPWEPVGLGEPPSGLILLDRTERLYLGELLGNVRTVAAPMRTSLDSRQQVASPDARRLLAHIDKLDTALQQALAGKDPSPARRGRRRFTPDPNTDSDQDKPRNP